MFSKLFAVFGVAELEWNKIDLNEITKVLEHSEGTSSVAFEVLTINSEIDFINLFIFDCLRSNINLFIFNCLTSNINLFNFNCLTSNVCFSENTSFANRRKRLFMVARPYFRILNSSGKMMTCYLRDTNKFLRYRTLRTSILKWGFPAKGTELTRLVLFEVLEMPQLRGTLVWTILIGTVQKFAEYKWSYRVRNFSVVNYVGETSLIKPSHSQNFHINSWVIF